MMYVVSNDHSSVSHGMKLKRIATVSHILNVTGLPVSMHKITNRTEIHHKTFFGS